MHKLKNLLNKFKKKVIYKTEMFFKGMLLMCGALLGIRRLGEDKYDLKQLYVLGCVFLVTTPLLLLFFGQAVLMTWLTILLVGLMIANVDEVLMLSYMFSEFGAEQVLGSENYKEWMQDLYSSSASFTEFNCKENNSVKHSSN